MPQRRFAAFAWGVLAYNVAVILWGALVRATGSGAGCGGHWPLCNGEVLPKVSQIATVIELTHRAMSGVALVAVVAMFLWARRAFAPRHAARRWAGWALVLILTEALLGASLVLLGHVARNESAGRVYSLGLHLVNTLLLLASLVSSCLLRHAGRAAGRNRSGIAILALHVRSLDRSGPGGYRRSHYRLGRHAVPFPYLGRRDAERFFIHGQFLDPLADYPPVPRPRSRICGGTHGGILVSIGRGTRLGCALCPAGCWHSSPPNSLSEP